MRTHLFRIAIRHDFMLIDGVKVVDDGIKFLNMCLERVVK